MTSRRDDKHTAGAEAEGDELLDGEDERAFREQRIDTQIETGLDDMMKGS